MNRIRQLAVRARDELAGRRLQRTGYVENAAGVRIHLDPTEFRARRLFRCGGAVDGAAVRAWQLLFDRLEPELLIDIGANYGEVSLSLVPRSPHQVFLLEPNPKLIPFLEASTAPFPNVTVVHVAASDVNGHAMLHLDHQSSGLSRIDGVQGSDGSVEVKTARVDDLGLPVAQSLLFKIDTEGHENQVLGGMQRTLAETELWVGLIELNDPGIARFAPFAYRFVESTATLIEVDPMSPQEVVHGLSKDVVVSNHQIIR